jgi:hypothetical protein
LSDQSRSKNEASEKKLGPANDGASSFTPAVVVVAVAAAVVAVAVAGQAVAAVAGAVAVAVAVAVLLLHVAVASHHVPALHQLIGTGNFDSRIGSPFNFTVRLV